MPTFTQIKLIVAIVAILTSLGIGAYIVHRIKDSARQEIQIDTLKEDQKIRIKQNEDRNNRPDRATTSYILREHKF